MSLFFPAVHEDGDEGGGDEGAQPRPFPKERGGLVLLVEDEEALLSMVGQMLERGGYRVLYARNGREALSIQEKIGAVDVLLTDVVMPVMNGRELSSALRHRFPRMKVLYMSGYPSEIMDSEGNLEEGVAFVQKPFSREMLLGALARLLEGEAPSEGSV